MKELQAKAKVTQTMTRDGLVMENQADGTVENVSSREAEQDYSTDSEGKTEKILERTEDVKDKHKAKKKAKQAAETAESEDGLHRSAARLELTEEERADPALQPYIQKAGAKADKLDAARAALPKKRVPVKEKVYDAASGKARSTLRFEQQDKGPPSLKPNPASRPLSEALLFAHGKIHEVEHENVGVEGGHKGKQLVPTKDGINLAVVLPESLTSPILTAEWENRLTEIAKGKADADEFMAEIEAQVRQLVKTYSCISADKQNLFQSERVIIGKCPRCGENVYEGKKNFYCGNRGCQFVMWKNDCFFEQRKKAFTPKIAAALLKNGKAKVKGLYSEKTGKTYDATVLLADTGGKYVNYRVERKE